jgi:2-methylcitrate dehydratase
MGNADRIARYVTQTGLRDFAPEVIERAKDLCLSSIGSAVLGAGMAVPRALTDYVRAQGGAPEAGVIGHGFATTAELAAMLNCNASHCTEYEDVAWPEAQYTCCLIPAMFSLGQKLGASGAAVLEAIIIGFEVAARPGMICSNHGAAARGFLSCANNGTIGVASGAAKLMGLAEAQVRDAVTLAASMGGGLVRQTGSAAHVVEAGFTARDGIAAATLAARGLGGNPTILDGKAGYYDALAGQPDLTFDLGTGGDARILAVGQKKYPCCYMLQRIIDGVRALAAEHGIAADDVAEVRVEVNAAFPAIMKYPEPRDVEQARFSLPHVVAAALAGEPMDARTFSAARLDDPAIVAGRARVRMIVHEDWGYDQLGGQDVVTIALADGRELRTVCTRAHGDAEDPLSREETLAKYRACTDGLLGEALRDEVAGTLCALEEAASVAAMMERLAGEARLAMAA